MMKLQFNEYCDTKNGFLLFFSYEWLPSLENDTMENLVKRVTKYSKEFQPKFCSVTWHNNIKCVKDNLSLKFAINLHQQGLTVLLHICSRGLSKDNVYQLLEEMQKNGLKNIFALKGDDRGHNGTSYFLYAKDLVRFIRENFGSYFTIGVAGYPSGHPDSHCRSEELMHLKEKVDTGADFIITQIVFDPYEFVEFVKNCRAIGITVPIIPGILPLQNVDEMERMSKMCRITVPSVIKSKIIELQDKPTELEDFGVKLAADIIKSIMCSGIEIHGVHLFSLNRPQICLKVKKELHEYMASR